MVCFKNPPTNDPPEALLASKHGSEAFDENDETQNEEPNEAEPVKTKKRKVN